MLAGFAHGFLGHFPIRRALADFGIPIDKRPFGRFARFFPNSAANAAELYLAGRSPIANQFRHGCFAHIAQRKSSGKTVAEWDEGSVGLEDERRDRFGEWPGCSVSRAGSRKKSGGIFGQEVAIEKIEMNDDPIAGFGLEPGGFDKSDGELVVVWRPVGQGLFGPPDHFERMDLEEFSALPPGKIRNPLQFVTIKLREGEDETEGNPGLAQEREPVLHRLKGARRAAHAIMGFRLTIETDRDETIAGVTQPTDAAFIQQHPVSGY